MNRRQLNTTKKKDIKQINKYFTNVSILFIESYLFTK